jgi:hypothetical protein
VTIAALPGEAANLCPPWAFDPANRTERPRTRGKWQPIWIPAHAQPQPGFEVLVHDILAQLAVAFYERIRWPIPIQAKLPDPGLKRHPFRRKLLTSDFFLPEYNLVIEIYSGYSKRRARRKRRFLIRASQLYGVRYLLLTPREWNILLSDESRLIDWIYFASAA